MTSNQNRRLALGLSVLVVVIGAATVDAQRQRRMPRFNEEVLVKPGAAMVLRRLGANDHLMAFSSPVSLPGVSLAAGAYVFRTGPSRTVQVLSADRSIAYAWLLNYRVL